MRYTDLLKDEHYQYSFDELRTLLIGRLTGEFIRQAKTDKWVQTGAQVIMLPIQYALFIGIMGASVYASLAMDKDIGMPLKFLEFSYIMGGHPMGAVVLIIISLLAVAGACAIVWACVDDGKQATLNKEYNLHVQLETELNNNLTEAVEEVERLQKEVDEKNLILEEIQETTSKLKKENLKLETVVNKKDATINKLLAKINKLEASKLGKGSSNDTDPLGGMYCEE